MRAIRLVFVVILAIVLILVAAANRGMVTVGMLPAGIAEFTGRDWTVSMPLFLALFLAMVFGVLVGLFGEWLRESHIRSESKKRAKSLVRLEREVGDLRRTHATPKDEVLAIIDEGKAARNGTSLPATR